MVPSKSTRAIISTALISTFFSSSLFIVLFFLLLNAIPIWAHEKGHIFSAGSRDKDSELLASNTLRYLTRHPRTQTPRACFHPGAIV
jgi:hypothetical protein